jgi:hypothetical protein
MYFHGPSIARPHGRRLLTRNGKVSNAGRLDEDLPALQRQLAPDTEFILGEFGHAYMGDIPAAQWRFIEAVKAAKRAHVPIVTVWEAFTTIDLADGLLDFDGNERLVLRLLRDTDANAVLDMSGPIAILGIRDRGDSPSEGRRYFELYGRFPANATQTYDVKLVYYDSSLPIPAPVTITAPVTFQSQGQINVWIEMQSDKRWYVFWVQRSDNATSNEFGPCLVVLRSA